MPTFDIECGTCSARDEVFLRKVGDWDDVCLHCGGTMHRVYALANTQSTGFKPFWHPHLGHTPVLVESWSHYKKLLRERNASNELVS